MTQGGFSSGGTTDHLPIGKLVVEKHYVKISPFTTLVYVTSVISFSSLTFYGIENVYSVLNI